MWVGSTSDGFSERKCKDRVRFVSIFFVVGFVIILLRLFFLQVMKGDDFAEVSESNRTHTIFLGAPRGNFYDKQGVQMVTNRPSWALMYSPPSESPITEEEMADRLRPFLEPFQGRWEKRLKRAFKSKQLVRLIEDVPSPVAFGMREMGDLLPGLRIAMEFRRDYPNNVQAIQMLGYLSEIDENELVSDQWFARKPGDLIGKMGLERILDSKLRGQDGGMLIEVDSIGRLKRIIRELPYQKGSSIRVTIDSKLQKLAEEALAKTSTQRGAAVALDIKTGAVRAWVSAPQFDPSGSLAEDVLDPKLPFFDRVYKGAYPPGSLYKLITAAAALEAGVVNVKDKVTCKGFVTLKDRRMRERKYRCWTKHGEVDFKKAIVESCDTYYYLMGHQVGPNRIHQMSVNFGLGQALQDVLPNENKGNIPNPSWKRKRGLGGWSTGDTYNMSIGQGYVTSTPLQMAVVMAGFASRGLLPEPYIIEEIRNDRGVATYQANPTFVNTIQLKDTTWDRILAAAKKVVDGGTGRASYVPHLDIYGKTGTAQNPHGNDHAWFFAAGGYKGEEPSLAICVFVENGGNGGSAAAPIVRQLFEAAFPKQEQGETI